MTRVWLLMLACWAGSAYAGPYIEPGDLALRQDIQRLADFGIIKGTTTTWPLAWGPIIADLQDVDAGERLPDDVNQALARVRARADWETATRTVTLHARASAAAKPSRIRSFQDTPREKAELLGGISWTGDRISIDLVGSVLKNAVDKEDVRVDGSQVAVAAGNWTLSANTLDRWWGPGWDGSLILSNNARPFPALSIDRNFTDAFETRWLRWLGPWDLSIHFGQLESDRTIPDTRFFGMRFNFRPLQSLEIGISRTALWCGTSRPCDLKTFRDLLLGEDNVSADQSGPSNEPGDQLAGLDFRWAHNLASRSFAIYGQFIGEDEAGGLPSRDIAQLGVDTSGLMAGHWSYRAFVELALTNCGFLQSEEHFNCAYNHNIYQTGYRYRGRVIGHGSDGDSRIISAGLLLVDDSQSEWHALARYGNLNRYGGVDLHHSLTPTQQDIWSADLVHRRHFRHGTVELGLGFEHREDIAGGTTESDTRAFVSWSSGY